MSVSWILALALLAGAPQDDEFIVLSEFQVWADAASPEVFEELNARYLAHGHSHVFELYPRYELFVWDLSRMQRWVDEAKSLGAFNLFCIGDDVRTADGYLFTPEGVNPKLREVLLGVTSYAHELDLMVAVEPVALPATRDREHFVPWLHTWLGPEIPAEQRADVVKLSIEWFGAYGDDPALAEGVEAFFEACREVAPEVLVYVDSIGGKWRQPQPFHRWLLHRFPGTIVSHYLNTDQVEAFRAMGARNMMVQVNPSELAETAGQFFLYHHETVGFLQDAVRKRVRFLSLAGVNYGYHRTGYDQFLEVVRPHLQLARSLEELRGALVPDEVGEPVMAAEVRQGLLEERTRSDPPVPENAAGRPAFFGSAPEGFVIRRLAAIGDGEIGLRFRGAYTDPVARQPVGAVFAVDFGEKRGVHEIDVTPCLHPSEPVYVARDLRLELRIGGTWRPLPGGTIRGNSSPELHLELPPCQADAVRLVIETESDDGKGNYRACCQELKVR